MTRRLLFVAWVVILSSVMGTATAAASPPAGGGVHPDVAYVYGPNYGWSSFWCEPPNGPCHDSTGNYEASAVYQTNGPYNFFQNYLSELEIDSWVSGMSAGTSLDVYASGAYQYTVDNWGPPGPYLCPAGCVVVGGQTPLPEPLISSSATTIIQDFWAVSYCDDYYGCQTIDTNPPGEEWTVWY